MRNLNRVGCFEMRSICNGKKKRISIFEETWESFSIISWLYTREASYGTDTISVGTQPFSSWTKRSKFPLIKSLGYRHAMEINLMNATFHTMQLFHARLRLAQVHVSEEDWGFCRGSPTIHDWTACSKAFTGFPLGYSCDDIFVLYTKTVSSFVKTNVRPRVLMGL